MDGPDGTGTECGIVYGGDVKGFRGRDDLLCVPQSSSPAACYLFTGLMIKSTGYKTLGE